MNKRLFLKMFGIRRVFVLAALCLGAGSAPAQPVAGLQPYQQPHQQELRSIYKELVEINTTDSAGSCTEAAQAMAARLRAGGLPDADIRVLAPPGAPKKGNLVARFRAADAGGPGMKKPVLLLAHIDVVEARREDWQRDPFRLVEENGYFHARGSSDNKAMAAVFVANLIRYRAEGYRPERDIVVALTCDEEIIPSEHNGVEFLLKHHRPLIDAEFALNEGGGGIRDAKGTNLRMTVLAAEKVFQSYRLEVTNPGGHSAQPQKDNAIYRLAGGLARLGAFDFPVRLSEITREYFDRMSRLDAGQLGADMKALLGDPPDREAIARLSRIPAINAYMRTTCVATMMDAGHATNALPQRARAVVNCRVLPGEPVEEVQRTLVRVMRDPAISVTPMGEATLSPPAPLTREILGPVEALTAQMWPGLPLVPTMIAGATDGRFLNNAGIPTYGISGMFRDADGSGVHGLNERFPVSSLYEGQEFLYRLVKSYAGVR